jgi:hypothetical protein
MGSELIDVARISYEATFAAPFNIAVVAADRPAMLRASSLNKCWRSTFAAVGYSRTGGTIVAEIRALGTHKRITLLASHINVECHTHNVECRAANTLITDWRRTMRASIGFWLCALFAVHAMQVFVGSGII